MPPWRTLDECLALMTGKRVRHLPVLDKHELVGMVSMGVVVKTIIPEQNFEIRELEEFVDEALKSRAR